MKIFKTTILLSLFLALITTATIAQTLRIDTTEITYENKLRPCFAAKIDPDTKATKKEWASYLKKNYKLKTSGLGLFTNDDLLTNEDITIASISDKRMNLYARITETPNGTFMKVFASFGYDFFINEKEYPKEFAALHTLMNNFLMEYLNEYYSDEVKSLNKELRSLNKEKVSLMKSTEKNKRKLESASNDIAVIGVQKYTDTAEDIKQTQKLNKLSENKIKMQNENRQAELSIQTIEEKVSIVEKKIANFQEKHKGLIMN